MTFQTSNVIEKSFTKTFASTDVGSYGQVTLELDTPIKPNINATVTVTGTSGVVTSNLWNLELNGGTSSKLGTINTNGTPVQINVNGVIDKIVLKRASIASAGDITLSVKYSDDESYIPASSISQDVEINSTTPTQTIVLDNAITSPCLIGVKLADKLNPSLTSQGFSLKLLDANDNVLVSVGAVTNDTFVWSLNNSTTAVKKVMVSRNGSASSTFTVTLSIP